MISNIIHVDLKLNTFHIDENSPSYWYELERNAIAKTLSVKPIERRAKNVIIFLGDGMGISTITAARIFKGQMKQKTGEEGQLVFEQMPFTTLVKVHTHSHSSLFSS